MWVPPRVAGRRAPRNKFLRVHSFRRMPRNFPRLRNIWFQPEMSFRDIFSLLVQYYLCSSHTYSWKFEEFFAILAALYWKSRQPKKLLYVKRYVCFLPVMQSFSWREHFRTRSENGSIERLEIIALCIDNWHHYQGIGFGKSQRNFYNA